MKENPKKIPPTPEEPQAKKQTSRVNSPPKFASASEFQRGRSEEKISSLRTEEAGVVLSPAGLEAYEKLVAQADIKTEYLNDIVEREIGDKDKIMRVLENLVLGARHREAFGDVGWTWSHFSHYRQRYPGVQKTYQVVKKLGEEFRAICREDEAHRRAVEGVEEPIYAASGKFCGYKVRYSDTLLAMFLKADNPEKFMERQEVKSTGVVLNLNMGLRDTVREKAMEPSEVKAESPFADEKPEEP